MGTNNIAEAVEAWLMGLLQASVLHMWDYHPKEFTVLLNQTALADLGYSDASGYSSSNLHRRGAYLVDLVLEAG